MDLYNSIHHSLDRILFDFAEQLSEKYELNIGELTDFINVLAVSQDEDGDVKISRVEPEKKSMTCMYKLSRGKNKGKLCPKKALDNGFCGTHQQHASFEIQSLTKKTGLGKPKPMSKTQLQIIEMLNTAVPQTETVLKRHPLGLHHEETDLMFDENFMVIGRVNGSKIVELSDFELNQCETNGWKYLEEAVGGGDESD